MSEKYRIFWVKDINISLNENKIKVAFGNFKIISKVIDGTFPDYTKVVPKNNDKNFSTKTNDLKSAIDRVSAVAINEEMKSQFKIVFLLLF